jgi:hypothetical protein
VFNPERVGTLLILGDVLVVYRTADTSHFFAEKMLRIVKAASLNGEGFALKLPFAFLKKKSCKLDFFASKIARKFKMSSHNTQKNHRHY